MKNKIIKISIGIVCLLIVIFLIYDRFLKDKIDNTSNESGNVTEKGQAAEYSGKDVNTDYDPSSTSYVTLKESSITVENSDAKVNGRVVTLVSAGSYYVTGTLIDGSIIVDAGDEDDIHIIFDNVNIKNSNYSPVYVKNADKVIITLEENSVNTLIDGESYANQVEEEPNAVIFSHDDLTINGTGTLNITANYQDGIVSKDDLVIISSKININSVDDGIRGKDSITINDVAITVNSVGDAIKTTNDTETDKGYIIIESGVFTLKTTGSKVSSKGIKATTNITINTGTFIIDSIDDAIHSNNSIVINGGEFNVSSNDDGIHADTNVTINDAKIDIVKSYEGIEGLNVTINGGTINITSSDDGINGAGGVDSSGRGGPRGNDNYSGTRALITINGGTITIYAGTSGNGDGLDSNGNIKITGGIITITSPANPRDWSTVDRDGTLTMTGGELHIDGTLYTSSNIKNLPTMQPGGQQRR